jgi:hypothetical protein
MMESQEIFLILATESQALQDKGEALGDVINELAKKNGSGDGVRRRLRKKVRKSALIEICKDFKVL